MHLRGAGDLLPTGERYGVALHAVLRWHHRHTLALALAVRHPALAEAGVAAAADSQRAFDDLCALTLGRGLVTPRLVVGVLRRLPALAAAHRAAERCEGRDARRPHAL